MKNEKWYYPTEIADDLKGNADEIIPSEVADDSKGVDLSPERKAECFACAWEYTRCVIPQYTNWKRYVAFMRIIVMGIIAEFRGSMVNVMASDEILSYSLNGVLDELFAGTPGHLDMAREYKNFLLITSEKTSSRRTGDLFRRYVDALASSPQNWFRLRDCDALARFTIAAALACNDLDDVWFSESQFSILTEIGDTLYDAIAFYKHRAEGETNSTFAYMPPDHRVEAFRSAREVLWALDVANARRPELLIATNFVRFFGGPIHMMMRRYRFVEEDLSIGKTEDDTVVTQTRQNFKLWNRVDAESKQVEDDERLQGILSRQDELVFPGFADILTAKGISPCPDCHHRDSYGAEEAYSFGGVALCEECQTKWHQYQETLPERAKDAFPEIELHPSLPKPLSLEGQGGEQHCCAM